MIVTISDKSTVPGLLLSMSSVIGILYYGEILGKRTKWEEFIMLNLKFLPPF
jgi:hypothetical protein